MKAVLCSVLGLSLGFGLAFSEGASVTRISEFSGEPVPRFESLRYAAANGRQGPSRNHEIIWRYERKGLPVLIIKESNDWRRVRDPDGDEVWMHKRVLNGRPSALVQTDTQMHRKPLDDSRVKANLTAGVLAELGNCKGGWCYLTADGHKGWVRQTHLWGADSNETGL